jgi:hypothetical protein
MSEQPSKEALEFAPKLAVVYIIDARRHKGFEYQAALVLDAFAAAAVQKERERIVAKLEERREHARQQAVDTNNRNDPAYRAWAMQAASYTNAITLVEEEEAGVRNEKGAQ